LEDDFLGYLDEWNAEVKARQGLTETQKKKMTLSEETVEGLRMTGINRHFPKTYPL
jgi:oligoribonuclease (3'-5' exoribonuclease)